MNSNSKDLYVLTFTFINTNDYSSKTTAFLKNNTLLDTKNLNNQKRNKNSSFDLFNKTMRNQDLPVNFTTPILNESNIFISEKSATPEINDNLVPQPPKINEKVKTLRFLASVDNELLQMENV